MVFFFLAVDTSDLWSAKYLYVQNPLSKTFDTNKIKQEFWTFNQHLDFCSENLWKWMHI